MSKDNLQKQHRLHRLHIIIPHLQDHEQQLPCCSDCEERLSGGFRLGGPNFAPLGTRKNSIWYTKEDGGCGLLQIFVLFLILLDHVR